MVIRKNRLCNEWVERVVAAIVIALGAVGPYVSNTISGVDGDRPNATIDFAEPSYQQRTRNMMVSP